MNILRLNFWIFFCVITTLIGCNQKVEVKTYYEDGSLLSKVEMRNNIKDGRAFVYYRNGNIKESGIWVKDKQEGLWKFYYETGALYAEVGFKNGVQHGESAFFYPNYKKMSISSFEFGKANGQTELFYENGNIKERSYWKDNKLDSLQILYDTSGNEMKRNLIKSTEQKFHE
ncbi:MAG: toxin-antitoxin system YwqK family antitoxin [Chitinophagaceae bacterium]